MGVRMHLLTHKELASQIAHHQQQADQGFQGSKVADQEIIDGFRQYDLEQVAIYKAELAKREKMTKIGEMIYRGFIEAKDQTGRIRVSYRANNEPYSRKDHANVYLYGSDNHANSMQSVHISELEQYISDHGGDPNGVWIDTMLNKEVEL